MQYPLKLRFKVLALAEQISVSDATGIELFYVKQKLFKLKENIEIFRDNSKSELLFTVKADKVLDFSPTYTLSDAGGGALGTIKRQGARSLWKASYDLRLHSGLSLHVREANPWTKVIDGFIGELPIIGMFMGYLFHPSYIIESGEGNQVALLAKKPAFFEGMYSLEATGLTGQDEQQQLQAAALLMIVALMERARG